MEEQRNKKAYGHPKKKKNHFIWDDICPDSNKFANIFEKIFSNI